MQTHATKKNDITRKWYVIDATDKVLGRLASEVARVLMGKKKTYYAPHLDTGDFVVVINAEKVKLTGNKLEQKYYFRHTGYPGGARFVHLDKLLASHPERVIQYAVRGMVPHTKLGNSQLKKLKIYVGPDHPHEAQQPEPLVI